MDITPGHKLYKETNNASDQKSKGFKPQGMANMTSNEAITTADTAAKQQVAQCLHQSNLVKYYSFWT